MLNSNKLKLIGGISLVGATFIIIRYISKKYK